MEKKLRIQQIHSTAGRLPVQRKTIKALGLDRIRRTVELNDTPQVRGMINRVGHLVSVEEVTK